MTPENNENGELTTTVRQITGTPFQLRWVEEKGHAFGIGTKRVSKWYETEDEAVEEINKIDWEILTNVIDVLIEYKLEQIEIERRIKEQK